MKVQHNIMMSHQCSSRLGPWQMPEKLCRWTLFGLQDLEHWHFASMLFQVDSASPWVPPSSQPQPNIRSFQKTQKYTITMRLKCWGLLEWFACCKWFKLRTIFRCSSSLVQSELWTSQIWVSYFTLTTMAIWLTIRSSSACTAGLPLIRWRSTLPKVNQAPCLYRKSGQSHQ